MPKMSAFRLTSRLCKSTIGLSLVLVAMVVAMSGTGCPPVDPNPPCNTNTPPAVLAQDHIEGDMNAPVTLIEYSDFQCPFCGNFARQILPELRTKYIATGKVRLVFRHFPLSTSCNNALSSNLHPQACDAARASECAADQNLFKEYHDELFLDDSRRSAMSTANLKQYGTNVGVDQTTFDACVDGNSKSTRVGADVASGIALGVTATPTVFVGAQKLSGPTKDQLFAAIDAALVCAGATPP